MGPASHCCRSLRIACLRPACAAKDGPHVFRVCLAINVSPLRVCPQLSSNLRSGHNTLLLGNADAMRKLWSVNSGRDLRKLARILSRSLSGMPPRPNDSQVSPFLASKTFAPTLLPSLLNVCVFFDLHKQTQLVSHRSLPFVLFPARDEPAQVCTRDVRNGGELRCAWRIAPRFITVQGVLSDTCFPAESG